MAEIGRRERLEPLLEAARLLQSPENEAGKRLRSRLAETTGLSSANIAHGLTHCLEAQPSEAELAQLLASTPTSRHAHVLLSANVFVAALRAIAIGVASSPRVTVRASRREPALAEALHDLTPASFELVTELTPQPGEHLWAYGADETLAEIRAALPRGVWFHAHGSGIGAIVLDARRVADADLRHIAVDTARFDQRGCLSPRLVCVHGTTAQARAIAETLALALADLEIELPCGRETAEERADARQQRDAAAYAFELFDAGHGWVSCSADAVVPPSGRHLHVFASADPAAVLTPFQRHLTCLGSNAEATLASELASAFPGARRCSLGQMQRPPLDGPVDLRHGSAGELLA